MRSRCWPVSGLLLSLSALAAAQGAPGARPARPRPKPVDAERASAPAEDEQDDEVYHTPLAGKRLETEVFGEPVVVEERDRGELLALSLGATYFTPDIGQQRLLPLAALYAYKVWGEQRQVRAVLSGVVNTVDYAERLYAFEEDQGAIEGLLHFENNTIPLATTEIIDGQDLEYTALRWGWTGLWAGLGYRLRIPPGEVDNDLQVQLLYTGAYHYFTRVDETGEIDGVEVVQIGSPPDTFVHGGRLRFRLDALQRNLLELPHWGLGVGADVELSRRDRWTDHGPTLSDGTQQFDAAETRDFLKVQAYVVFAGPLPVLSERHRLICQLHWGWAPKGDLDRFNAFRLGGGPPPTEAADLGRSPYPGAMFDQFSVRWYLVGSLEYRLELAFWLYLHFRLTVAWGEVPTFDGTPGPPLSSVRLVERRGEAYSFGVSSGFLWDSTLYVEYTYDSGAVRAGDDGSTLLVAWSKAF